MSSSLQVGPCKIPLSSLHFSFSRSGGPGGQNVNKVATQAELRFHLKRSHSIPPVLKERALKKLAARLTANGEILVKSRKTRSQAQNRQDCLEKFRDLLEKAFRRPKARKATKPTKSSRERRIREKKKRGEKKKWRRSRPGHDD